MSNRASTTASAPRSRSISATARTSSRSSRRPTAPAPTIAGRRAWRSSSAGTPRTASCCGDATCVRVAVVGAGLAGLAAADALATAGLSRSVLEARDRVGGRVHSRARQRRRRRDGRRVHPARLHRGPGGCRSLRARPLGQGHALRPPRAARRRGAAPAPRGSGRAIDAALAAARAGAERSRELLDGLEIDSGAREAILARLRSPRRRRRAGPAESWRCWPGSATSPRRASPAATSASPRHWPALGRGGSISASRSGRSPTRRRRRGRDRAAASFAADRCVIAVPAHRDRPDRAPPGAVRGDRCARLDRLRPRREAVRPPPGPVAPSATLAVPDRYWAWTASGDEDGASQPVVSAFAGSAAALAGLADPSSTPRPSSAAADPAKALTTGCEAPSSSPLAVQAQ